MRKSSVICLTVLGMLLVPCVSMAQSVTAPFVATPPTIDGSVEDGEWDAAATVEGTWTAHDGAAEASVETIVRVLYSIDAVYFLYECVDDNVQSSVEGTEYYHGGPNVEHQMDSTFAWGGDTDYVSLYIDPANYGDDQPNADFYSYSIQWEPSITAKDEADHDGNSYNYTELGQFGGALNILPEPIVDLDGDTHYWTGGVAWQAEGLEIVDGPSADGYACEVKVPFEAFNGYGRHVSDAPFQLDEDLHEVFVNSDATDPLMNRVAAYTFTELSEDETVVGMPGFGIVNGMPSPGTTWKVQFCRYSEGDLGYVNWVGDTGGFVTRPFGDLIFGEASGTDVAEALLHIDEN